MSKFELRDNSGSLFKNQRKEQETHADFTGTVMVNGVEMYINAWKKQTSAGDSFLSLSFRPKKDAADTAKGASKKPPQDEDFF